ncbi:MAG: ABC transporter ATP-binding protein [Acidobacteriota bacterium]
MTTPAVLAEGLTKTYGELRAVAGIDFRIEKGECFGLLGPNGAGKSTTMRMIYRATPVGGGRLEVLGHPVSDGPNDREVKRRLGVVPQEQNLDEYMSARENLRVFTRFFGLGRADAERRVEELLEFVGLSDRSEAPVITLSGGLKRRLQVARGLLGRPDLLVLDEPTTGLDPQARNRLWQQLVELSRGDTTLVLSTHYMDEAEKLCDRLLIMDAGKVVDEGSPDALIDRHVAPQVVELRLQADDDIEALEEQWRPRVTATGRLPSRLLLYVDDGEGLLASAVTAHPDLQATLRRSHLEDVFLALTGRGLEG